MAKHEKKPRTQFFQKAEHEITLFGLSGQIQRHPLKVRAGAFYGRDERGYWVLQYPRSEYRACEAIQVLRYSAGYGWQKTVERGTAVFRAIQHNLPIWDTDDKSALSKSPSPRYHNPRSLNKGFRENTARRENRATLIPLRPAETCYTITDFRKPADNGFNMNEAEYY